MVDSTVFFNAHFLTLKLVGWNGWTELYTILLMMIVGKTGKKREFAINQVFYNGKK